MLIARLDDLPKLNIECPTCNCSFDAVIFSRAFSSDIECICYSCGVQARISPYSNAAKYITGKDEKCKIEHYFISCECGGQFLEVGRRYDLYRCPNCKERLDETYVVTCLGVDERAWSSGVPFCSHVEIDGEEIDYTNPGLETIGHIDEEIWNYDIDDKQFHEALTADREFRIRSEQEEAFNNIMIDGIQRKIANGSLPQKIFIMAELNAFLFIRVGDRYSSINPTELGLPIELIDECRDWARLGSYIEDGIWGGGDLPEAFTKTSWDDYFQAGLKIQKRLQEALANRTIVELLVEPDGEPFFEEKA